MFLNNLRETNTAVSILGYYQSINNFDFFFLKFSFLLPYSTTEVTIWRQLQHFNHVAEVDAVEMVDGAGLRPWKATEYDYTRNSRL